MSRRSTLYARRGAGARRGFGARNGEGTIAPPAADTTAPVLSSVSSTPGTTTASVTATSNESGTVRLRYGTTAGYGSTTAGQAMTAGVPFTISLSGLGASTTYHYTIDATDLAGNTTAVTDRTFLTGAAGDTTPPTLSSVTATPTTNGVTIRATSNETGTVVIRYGPTSSYGANTPSQAITASTQFTVAIGSLAAGTVYHYTIEARDAAGNPAAVVDRTFTTATIDTTAPVITIASETPGVTSATISGTVNELSTVVLKWGTSAGVYPNTSTVGSVSAGQAFNAIATGLTASTLYHYVVTATDAANNVGTTVDDTFTTGAAGGSAVNLPNMTLLGVNTSTGAWAATYTDAGNVTTRNHNPNYETIHMELRFTGDDDINATCALEFKRSADVTWRTGIPLWRAQQTKIDYANYGDRVFAGSVLKCDPNTSYDVRLTITDGAASATITATIATRANPSMTVPVTTHYLNSQTGNDTTGNGSLAFPWRTLSKAYASTPANAVIELQPGYYAPIGNINGRLTTITWKATNPACADQAANKSVAVINSGSHSIIHGKVVAAPTGQPTSDPHGVYSSTAVAPWVLTPLVGPRNGTTYNNVYRWAGANIPNTKFLSFSSTRGSDTPTRVHVVNSDNNSDSVVVPNLRTPGGWAELISTGASQRGTLGYQPPAGTDIYIRWTRAGTPNDYWWDISGVGNMGLHVNAANCRVTGLHFRNLNHGVYIGNSNFDPSGMTDTVIDHCYFSQIGVYGVFTQGVGPAPASGRPYGQYVDKVTVQHCKIRDSMLKGVAPTFATDENYAYWWAIKNYWEGYAYMNLQGYPPTAYPHAGPMSVSSQSVGVGTKPGQKRMVVRWCEFDGPFNAVTMANSGVGIDRYGGAFTDCSENLIKNISDDCFEPEHGKICWAIWGNRCEDSGVFISMGPLHWGPVYAFENEIWRRGSQGAPPPYNQALVRFPPGAVPALFKSQGTYPGPRAITYFIHNTDWSNQSDAGTATTGYHYGVGAGYVAANETSNVSATAGNPWYVFWNNIIRGGRNPYQARYDAGIHMDDDYNAFVSADPDAGDIGPNVVNVSYPSTATTGAGSIAEYRTAIAAQAGRPAGLGNGVHTNKFGVGGVDVAFGGSTALARIDALLTDPVNGDLSLKAGTNPLVEGGFPFANISDRDGTDFAGAQSAPDIGANQRDL